MKNLSLFNIIVFFGALVGALLLVTYLSPRPLISALFFFGIPTVIIIIKRHFVLGWEKLFITSFLGAVLAVILDAAITASRGWWIPNNQLIFPIRIFSILNVDNALWYFIYSFFLLITYVYFLDEGYKVRLSKNIFTLSALVIAAVALLLFYKLPNLLFNISYPCLIIALPATLLPIVYFSMRSSLQKFLLKILPIYPYLILVNLGHELTALKIGQWQFNGQYVGKVALLGVLIPTEEFIFYIILYTFSASGVFIL